MEVYFVATIKNTRKSHIRKFVVYCYLPNKSINEVFMIQRNKGEKIFMLARAQQNEEKYNKCS